MVVVGIAVLPLSCGDSAVEPAPPTAPVATTVTVNPSSAALNAFGETARFTAEVRDQNGQVMRYSDLGEHRRCPRGSRFVPEPDRPPPAAPPSPLRSPHTRLKSLPAPVPLTSGRLNAQLGEGRAARAAGDEPGPSGREPGGARLESHGALIVGHDDTRHPHVHARRAGPKATSGNRAGSRRRSRQGLQVSTPIALRRRFVSA